MAAINDLNHSSYGTLPRLAIVDVIIGIVDAIREAAAAVEEVHFFTMEATYALTCLSSYFRHAVNSRLRRWCSPAKSTSNDNLIICHTEHITHLVGDWDVDWGHSHCAL